MTNTDYRIGFIEGVMSKENITEGTSVGIYLGLGMAGLASGIETFFGSGNLTDIIQGTGTITTVGSIGIRIADNCLSKLYRDR
jgi:hypothetical protein